MADRGSRKKILKAAAEVAKEAGAGHMSLEAVAARAGLSKGGLLYNFPTKTALLKALVEHHLEEFGAKLARAERDLGGHPNGTAAAYLETYRGEAAAKEKAAGGILAAIADDLSLLDPVKDFSRDLIDRIGADADPVAGMIAYLAVEGLRSTQLFETDILTRREKEAVLSRLAAMLS
ncbi:MAG: TetR/AcrR family transcriptional regulator [Rhizobiaceae bacterium]|nr:TetR/AcrR family transcriptional regulator [Rhizobiaceae bacterium]MCV0409189.1 TetR/AcrR family transcriptional regulator [Rhizobiaceae bacterium]